MLIHRDRQPHLIFLVMSLLVLTSVGVAPTWARPFRCAAQTPEGGLPAAARPATAAATTTTHHEAIVIFAHFADENHPATPPAWAAGLLDPDRPGSVAHFYDDMSIGRHQLRGQVATQRYASSAPAQTYVSTDAELKGDFGRFTLDILQQADADIDFSNFDNDGPDGLPNSGDDDGVVDVVFINVATVPAGFLLREATGIADLGFESSFVTNDSGIGGTQIRIAPDSGTLQESPGESLTAGTMAHEYGHILGLPDLFDVQWTGSPTDPAQDSAGIGRWGLMGWGALGWEGAPGPNSLSAWSRLRLGWAQVLEQTSIEAEVELEPVGRAGQMGRVPLNGNEYFLLEYRRRDASHYDRGIPGEGLLIWHVRRAVVEGEVAFWWDIDLECADGLWQDAGFPTGQQAAPASGDDNLDFWAHDADYASRHSGNQGDATDLFDGMASSRFAADTNPAAISTDGETQIAVEEIALHEDRAVFIVRSSPPILHLSDVTPRSPRVTAGTPMAITFRLANLSGAPASDLRASVHTLDKTLEILTPEMELYPLPGGASSVGRGVGPEGFPKLRFPEDLPAEHAASVELTIYSGDAPVATATINVTGIPSHEIAVQVSDEQNPVPDVDVILTEGGSTSDLFYQTRVATDSTGSASFHVPTGSYTVRAVPHRDGPFGQVEIRDIWIDTDKSFSIDLPRAYTVSGVVRLSNEAPAGGQYVVFQGANLRYHYAYTESPGNYRIKLPAGIYDVRTQPAGGGGGTTQDHGRIEILGATTLDLQLQPGAQVTLRIVDEDGTWVNGVRVYATTSGQNLTVASVATGMDRDARLELLPGLYDLNLSGVPPPYLPPTSVESIEILTDTTITILLQRGLLVTGLLVDEDGQEVQWPSDANYNASFYIVGAAGFFDGSLHREPSRFELGVLPGAYNGQLNVYSSFGGDDFPFPSQPLGEIDIESDTTLTFVLAAGVKLEGRIDGYHNRGPDSYDRIELRESSGAYASTFVRSNGSFTTRLLPGLYTTRIIFNSGEALPPSQTLATIDVRQDTTVIWHLMDDELVRGQLVDITGLPVPNVRLQAISTTINGEQISNSSTTVQDGTFSLRLPDGRYAVQMSRVSALQQVSTSWQLPVLDVPPLAPPVFTIPSGAILRMIVTDDNGLHRSAEVSLHEGTFLLADAATELLRRPLVESHIEELGAVEIELAPGRYYAIIGELWAGSLPLYHKVVPSLVISDQTTLGATFAPPLIGANLSGNLLDTDGEPLSSAIIVVYDAETGILAETLGSVGSYTMPLPAGTYEIALLTSIDGEFDLAYLGGPIEVQQDRVFDIRLGTGTAVDLQAAPDRFALEQNYPNPFNASTLIEFSIPAAGDVRLELFDLLGQRVRKLLVGQLPAGSATLYWDGTDDAGRAVASGIYLYRLTTPVQSSSKKMLLIR
ncbi:MAG: T9SS type A sorting domain-containing protein [Gemmatimonadetes bacterium]|nr:T9SS type A sorting domain-containing protein [Gemmatimonadota bacterium]